MGAGCRVIGRPPSISVINSLRSAFYFMYSNRSRSRYSFRSRREFIFLSCYSRLAVLSFSFLSYYVRPSMAVLQRDRRISSLSDYSDGGVISY